MTHRNHLSISNIGPLGRRLLAAQAIIDLADLDLIRPAMTSVSPPGPDFAAQLRILCDDFHYPTLRADIAACQPVAAAR